MSINLCLTITTRAANPTAHQGIKLIKSPFFSIKKNFKTSQVRPPGVIWTSHSGSSALCSWPAAAAGAAGGRGVAGRKTGWCVWRARNAAAPPTGWWSAGAPAAVTACTSAGDTYRRTYGRRACALLYWIFTSPEHLHMLTANGLHLALTWRPALECSFQSRRPRSKYFCFLQRSLNAFDCRFCRLFFYFAVCVKQWALQRLPTCTSWSSAEELVPGLFPSWPDVPCCRESTAWMYSKNSIIDFRLRF